METLPSVSVVIPVYNGASTIRECLESVLAQNYPADALDVIVVDNASTDTTPQIVNALPVGMVTCRQRGPAAARNAGIQASRGEIVAFTDADCVADPNWIRELVRVYDDPTIGGVGGRILAFPYPQPNHVQQFSAEHAPLVNFVSGANEFRPHLYTANASFRIHALHKAGGFNAYLFTGEDVDLSWRVQVEQGAALAYAEKAVVYHHHRCTLRGLARQYRQYGFGEIMLDTIYAEQPNYPRDRAFQMRRMAAQAAALPRYAASFCIRRLRYWLKRETSYQANLPGIWLVVEASNLVGKFEALYSTGWMSDRRPIQKLNRLAMLKRYFPHGRE